MYSLRTLPPGPLMFGSNLPRPSAVLPTRGARSSKCVVKAHLLSNVRPRYFIRAPMRTSTPATSIPFFGGVPRRPLWKYIASVFWGAIPRPSSDIAHDVRDCFARPASRLPPVSPGRNYDGVVRITNHAAAEGKESMPEDEVVPEIPQVWAEDRPLWNPAAHAPEHGGPMLAPVLQPPVR